MVAGSRIVFEMTEMGSSGVHFTVSHAENISQLEQLPALHGLRSPAIRSLQAVLVGPLWGWKIWPVGTAPLRFFHGLPCGV
jgi:hypothetical protein